MEAQQKQVKFSWSWELTTSHQLNFNITLEEEWLKNELQQKDWLIVSHNHFF